ncbi:NACHT and WD repeat domain-containing protein 2 [Caerostris extrusa]|uniref:NACHT and WD repeat domain-containing protein 2 n=1 Tax=Caerostris extrusa TaxID=172846 RepID=A0AAV4NI63_CAEEX|nr:NACHT and WD repeat domain-containing protein 2 [Caerostris extrusa]
MDDRAIDGIFLGCLDNLPPVVDMRWGVRDEATDDHMTTDLCMREIENCQRLSMGPNFVISSEGKYHSDAAVLILELRDLSWVEVWLSPHTYYHRWKRIPNDS